jgi:uncharacterized protein (TIGR03435 family)
VIDRTELEGKYDFQLEFAPEPAAGKPETAAEDVGLPIFDAVQRQLGLRLEPARGPVEVLVIDHIERPSQN